MKLLIEETEETHAAVATFGEILLELYGLVFSEEDFLSTQVSEMHASLWNSIFGNEEAKASFAKSRLILNLLFDFHSRTSNGVLQSLHKLYDYIGVMEKIEEDFQELSLNAETHVDEQFLEIWVGIEQLENMGRIGVN